MALCFDYSWMSLNKASKFLGAQLDIANAVYNMLKDAKDVKLAKKFTVLLWDTAKKQFVVEVSLDRKVKVVPPLKKSLRKIWQLNKPLILKDKVILPLKETATTFGALVIRSKTVYTRRSEEIITFAQALTTAIANLKVFIDSERRSQDMFRFNVLSRALNPTVHIDEIVKILLQGIEGILKYDVAGVFVVGKDTQKIFIKSLTPISRYTVKKVRDRLIELTNSLTGQSLQLSKIEESVSLANGRAQRGSLNSVIEFPFITKGRYLGIFMLASFQKELFSARDTQNISTLVSHGAVAFENAMLYQNLRRTYFSIIRALTSAIEAKDEYTRGHSVLVSKYATAIAQAMGLSSSMRESVQIAGLLHDLGKIGVPEEILVKKGTLTENEYGIVKSHPDIAMKILEPVEFPHFSQNYDREDNLAALTLNFFENMDLSNEVKQMIYHHHEKFGGGGYPKGLAGEEIPLGARILAVADTFEALTANRPYRKAFSLQEALTILRKISGEQLDPKIVNVFISIIKKQGLQSLKAQTEF